MEWLPVFSTSIGGFPKGLCLDPYCSISWSNLIPQTLLIKYVGDITASVPVTIGLNHPDSSHQEVANIKRWADGNLMKLNMKKTFEMVVKGKTRMPLPESIDGIARKRELKLLGVTVNDRFCKRALRYGYTSKYTPITDVITIKDRLLWDKITADSSHPLHELLPPQRSRHPYILPRVRTERHKRCFVNRCLFNFRLRPGSSVELLMCRT